MLARNKSNKRTGRTRWGEKKNFKALWKTIKKDVHK